jgi:hypothetical protein
MFTSHHTAEYWAQYSRDLEDFIVKQVHDRGDRIELLSTASVGFARSKSELGREISVGERLQLETVALSRITGLRDAHGWLFHLTDQDLADEARRFSGDMHRAQVEEFERRRKDFAAQEEALPEWLRARINRFREAAGEKFLLEGWGYELLICCLADLLDRGKKTAATNLARDEGASGNQWDFATLLVGAHRESGDEGVATVPAGLAPITGSIDYAS